MGPFHRHRAPDASEVLPGLMLGSAPDAGQRRELHRRGVRVVVDLRAEVPAADPWEPDVLVRRVPVVDRGVPDAATLVELARWVLAAVRRGDVVLVHCHAGVGRAATVGCAILLELGYDLRDGYRIVREARPVIALTEPQLELLRHLDRAGRGELPRAAGA
jgi:Dual specificity phosphatase, catalytic domain